jgi:secreted trypsin-like serine protease
MTKKTDADENGRPNRNKNKPKRYVSDERVPAEACAWNPLDLGQDLCAGSFSSCSVGFCQDSCQGDSGRPLFQLKEDAVGKSYHEQIPDGGVIVFGLTSRGAACGTNQTPGIYASLHIAKERLRALVVADDTVTKPRTSLARV